MGNSYSKMKKQARQLEERISQMQGEMEKQTFTGVSSGGLVQLVIDGNGALKGIQIKPECVDPQDVEGLQDLIKDAFDNALEQQRLSPEFAQWQRPFP